MDDSWSDCLLKVSKPNTFSSVVQPKLVSVKLSSTSSSASKLRRVSRPEKRKVDCEFTADVLENSSKRLKATKEPSSSLIKSPEVSVREESIDVNDENIEHGFTSPFKKHRFLLAPSQKNTGLLNRDISNILDRCSSSSEVDDNRLNTNHTSNVDENAPMLPKDTKITYQNLSANKLATDLSTSSLLSEFPVKTQVNGLTAEELNPVNLESSSKVMKSSGETNCRSSEGSVSHFKNKDDKIQQSSNSCYTRKQRAPANMKTDNFVKLNMKQKTFCKGNSKFVINRKKFKHKQFQRARSRYENSYSHSNNYRKSYQLSQTQISYEAISLPESLAFVRSIELNPILQHLEEIESFDSEPCSIAMEEFESLLPPALKVFKLQNLQSWQRKCVQQLVSGNSSLVIKPTGSGKSLCYQLPALLMFKKYKSVTLVVSPLISLMDDQVKNCPRGLKAACFHSAMTEGKRNAVLKELQENKIAVLFVSPETIVEGFVLRQTENFPRISFACIDEVHCISQWSHNFRPSYFRLASTLKTVWGIKCFLGITATASEQTKLDIGKLLNVEQNRMFYDVKIPTNLRISASCDTHRLQSLIDLLEKDPFKSFASILIYCTKRNDCDAVASHIRTVFGSQEIADSYHAGKSSSERAQIQKKFMNESLKIVAATVAFGMGLNKAGIRAVIHFNISGSVENYIQEIGRAGRSSDEVAFCHTFLSRDSMVDLYEQERHVYSSYIEPSTIRKVADEVFKDLIDLNSSVCVDGTNIHYHYAAVDLSLASSFDVKEEVLMTLVSYLEDHDSRPLQIQKVVNNVCSAHFYSGFNLPKQFFDEFPALKVALKLSECGKGATRDGNKLSFKISTIANFLNLSYDQISRSLFRSQSRNAGIKISLTCKSIVYKVKCADESSKETLTEYLLDQTKYHENSKIQSLHFLFSQILVPVAQKSVFSCFDGHETNSQESSNGEIATKILNYFNYGSLEGKKSVSVVNMSEKDEYLARQTVRTFISLYHDMELSGLTVCRILQGMDSPLFPAQTWSTVGKFWKSLVSLDFKSLLRICNEEVRVCQ